MSVRILLLTIAIAIVTTAVAAAAEPLSTSTVDRARLAEFQSIFGGKVMAYTAADHSAKVNMDMEKGHKVHDEMAEGAKCGVHGHEGRDWGGWHGCGCRDGWYDCWGVWQPDSHSDFTSIRESDYDPVMGRGEFGGSFFGW